MVFWVAEGAGLFRREGLDVKVVTGNGRMLLQGQADVAIMPRPMFLTFVGEGAEVVAFANLLANDPINLVVSRAVAEARGVTREMPLAERVPGRYADCVSAWLQGRRRGCVRSTSPLDLMRHATLPSSSSKETNSRPPLPIEASMPCTRTPVPGASA